MEFTIVRLSVGHEMTVVDQQNLGFFLRYDSPTGIPIIQDGAPSRARVNRWFRKVAELTMVYGRYSELVHGDYFMVYKIYIWLVVQ